MAKHIWIIGASSGIGRALAIELAHEGHQLILSARRESLLNELNEKLNGAHDVIPFDVTDEIRLNRVIEQIGDIDSLIYMSGEYDPNPVERIDLDAARKIIEVNLYSPIALTKKILPRFIQRQRGQIVYCASVSGYRGLPKGQPYSSTKAAIINFAESLRCETAGQGIDVKIISPGFVETPMTGKNEFPMPMMISPETAAKAIAKGLSSNRFEIHMPKRFTYFTKLLQILPHWLYFQIAKKLN